MNKKKKISTAKQENVSKEETNVSFYICKSKFGESYGKSIL
jgi:hypothetical protein